MLCDEKRELIAREWFLTLILSRQTASQPAVGEVARSSKERFSPLASVSRVGASDVIVSL